MGAHAGGAIRQEGTRKIQGARRRIVRGLGPPAPFVIDPIQAGGADGIAVPRGAPVGLVEVGMPLDQPGQQQRATAGFNRRARRGRQSRSDGGDLSVLDEDIGGFTSHRADVAD